MCGLRRARCPGLHCTGDALGAFDVHPSPAMYADWRWLVSVTLLTFIRPATPLQVAKDAGPSFIGGMRNITVAAGRLAKLTCIVSNLHDYKVAWIRRRGMAILSVQTDRIAPDPRIRITQQNRRAWNLLIDGVDVTDQGWYTCQVNTLNVSKQHVFLQVAVPPDIVDDRSSGAVTALEGDNVTLTCHASGHPQPNVTWKRERQLSLPIDNFSPVYAVHGSRLFLGSVDRKTSSDYFCIASNGWPPSVSKRVQLRVHFKPEVRAVRGLVTGAIGGNITLTCTSQSLPIGIHYWTGPYTDRWQDRRRPQSAHAQMVQPDRASQMHVHDGDSRYQRRFTLTLSRLAPHQLGTYHCINENKHGRSVATVSVKVQPDYLQQTAQRRPSISDDALDEHDIITQDTYQWTLTATRRTTTAPAATPQPPASRAGSHGFGALLVLCFLSTRPWTRL